MNRSDPVRIGASARALASHGAALSQVMGSRAHRLLSLESLAADPAPGLDIAFMSRDITGASTKQALEPATTAAYGVLRRAPRLSWVQIHAAGADRPVYQELLARGVVVCTASGVNADIVAQSALAGLLALARELPRLMAAQRERRWAPMIQGHLPRDLRRQTVLLVGWGPIGQALGRLLQALGMQLIVVRHGAAPAGPGIETLRYADWRQALPRADWLVLTCPLTDETRGLVDADALAALAPGARLVNVSRGEVVVEADVVEALRSGHLGGACLDVFEHEPLSSDSPLWDLDKVIITPHSAGHSDGNEQRVADLFIANLHRWCTGQPLVNRVAGALSAVAPGASMSR